MDFYSKLPENFKPDIETAIAILKQEGCAEIFIFGSLANGHSTEKSDIDIAVKGCPRGKYFEIMAKLIMKLEHSIHLVNLDSGDDLGRFLQSNGELVHVA